MNISVPVFIFIITISLFSASTVPFLDIIQEAEALKSKGTKTRVYGSATGLVCGLQLCSEITPEPEPSEKDGMDKQQTDKMMPDHLTDTTDHQMKVHVGSQAVISGGSIPTDFPTIQTLSVVHANQIDPKTYLLQYEISAGSNNLEKVMISLHSDIQSTQTEVPALPANAKSVLYAIINANDPSSITAHIQSYH